MPPTVARLSRQSLAKALSRTAVRDLQEAERLQFIAEADGIRAWAGARAIEVALELMMTAKSKAVRATMAEFLASDARPPLWRYTFMPDRLRLNMATNTIDLPTWAVRRQRQYGGGGRLRDLRIDLARC